jgi:hypothetical protein
MQKDANGERTEEEAVLFKSGLGVMSSLYASLSGTTVLMQRHVPSSAPAGINVEEWNSTPYGQRGWVRRTRVA